MLYDASIDYVVPCDVQLCIIFFLNVQGGFKVRKRATIRNTYNQVPHLTQDTNGKLINSQLDITNESQEVSPFNFYFFWQHIWNNLTLQHVI